MKPVPTLRRKMLECKEDFPIFRRRAGLIYLDNASTSQKPQAVIDALARFYSTHNANPNRGVYSLAEEATAQNEKSRSRIAKWFHAAPDEVIFTKSATEGINLLMYSWGRACVKKGDEIITTVAEHHANLVPWQVLSLEKGANLIVLPLDKGGRVSMDRLKKAVSSRTRIVAINHVSNVLGTTNPVGKAASIVRRQARNALFVVDGCQSAPHQTVDFGKMGCDAFVCSPHKMLGPQGLGILIVRKDVAKGMPPFLFGGDMIESVSLKSSTWADPPRRFEGGTQHPAAVLAFHAALDYLEGLGMGRVKEHCNSLGKLANSLLGRNPAVTLYGNADDNNGIVSFSVKGVHAHDVAAVLAEDGIAVRAGHHCAQPLTEILGVPATVRASFSVYNSPADAQALARSVRRASEVFHGIA